MSSPSLRSSNELVELSQLMRLRTYRNIVVVAASAVVLQFLLMLRPHCIYLCTEKTAKLLQRQDRNLKTSTTAVLSDQCTIHLCGDPIVHLTISHLMLLTLLLR